MTLTQNAPHETQIRKWFTLFAKNKDEHAFQRLYQACTPRMFLLLMRLTSHNQAMSEDLANECWLRAATGSHAFQGKSTFQTWLNGIAVNCYREALRREKKTECLADEGASSGTTLALKLDLEKAIGQLPGIYREILVLHDLEGWSHREIGLRLDLSINTCKSRLSRARNLVKAAWRPAKHPHHQSSQLSRSHEEQCP